MLRAQQGQEAVLMEEAMKCLRAAQFNAAKAVEIYRNYQVSLFFLFILLHLEEQQYLLF